ncbi:copper transporter [Oerskovia sp. Sa1BUA8]|uniref:Copper transporter n=1 Tax=Oerskovia douganii TaxID=2762210 RepID=A0A9D5YZ51_9CELL|nr:copper transporter [Oerskovia douganii]MBE7701378.1 copper transporter [Oerskovia douganii]
MIDFRYHIVSLISVFLALAVGIILGAGPLQGAIGDQLTGQVEQLRLERNELRDELDATNLEAADNEEFIVAAGPQLVEGALQDRRVAVVDLGEVDGERYEAVQEQLEASGASVVGHVRLGGDWTAEDQEDARKVAANDVANLVSGVEEAGTDAKLAAALATSLSAKQLAAPEARTSEAVLIEQKLAEAGLIEVVLPQETPADVILLLEPQASTVPVDGTTEAAAVDDAKAYAVTVEILLAQAAQARSEGSLVAGSTPVPGDLISTITADADLAAVLSTVSGIEAPAGQISVPLALAARLGDKVGQFGFEEGATAVIPPAVQLPPVDRSPLGTADTASDAIANDPQTEG